MNAPTSPTEEDRMARLVLNAITEPGSLTMARHVADRGAVGTLERLRNMSTPDGRDVAQRLAALDPDTILARADADGLRFVVPGDREWPEQLDELEFADPLHERGGIPLGLWVKGSGSLAATSAGGVAVVGSRSATTYGTDAAFGIAEGVAAAGHTIVSGAAFGIDQAGHCGAIAADRPTIAVLACGADRAYPAAHRALLRRIAENGLVVSEAPIGGAPTRVRFLARNRLIAALAHGTVVVEAAIRSGALNTASWAAGLGRVLMGVPGPITSAPSQGVHELIRSRGALLVTRPEDVLEAVAPMGAQTLFTLREEPRPRDLLTGVERQVLDAVPLVRAVSLANIARTAGLHEDRVAPVLQRLDARGLVEQGGAGGWRLATDQTP